MPARAKIDASQTHLETATRLDRQQQRHQQVEGLAGRRRIQEDITKSPNLRSERRCQPVPCSIRRAIHKTKDSSRALPLITPTLCTMSHSQHNKVPSTNLISFRGGNRRRCRCCRTLQHLISRTSQLVRLALQVCNTMHRQIPQRLTHRIDKANKDMLAR